MTAAIESVPETASVSAAVHISPEHRADYVPPAAPIPSLRELQRGATERAFAHCIKQMAQIMDATIANVYLDETSRVLKSPNKHKLDEVGGVDGMRVVFRGQVQALVDMHPKSLRLTLPDRVNAALKVCDEHLARSEAFGQWLTEATAVAACNECVNAMLAMHMVLQPRPQSERDRVMRAYWDKKNPELELDKYANQ